MNNLFKPIKIRLERAEIQAVELCKQVSDWCSRNPIKVKCVLRENRLGFKLVQEDFDEPVPLEIFGLLVAEFIHNLRSLLDNLVFALARLKLDPPEKPKNIFFPIIQNELKFSKNCSQCLDQLPKEVASLIERLQPFQRNDPHVEGKPDQDPLVLLQWLSNTDKHQIPTVALVAPTEIAFSHSSKFYSDEDADLNVPPDVTIWAGYLEPGIVLLEHKTNRPIESVSGNFDCKAVVSIKTFEDINPLDKVVINLLNYTKLIVNQFTSFFKSTEIVIQINMKNKDQQDPHNLNDILDTLPKHLKPGDFMGTMKWASEIDHDSLKYKNVFLGFIDILGYKNLIKEFGDDAPRAIFQDILNAFSWAKSSKSSLKVSLFSDTLIIEADDDHPVGFWNMINVVGRLRNQLLQKGYLIRGSIVYGKHFNQKGVWVSPCLIKAYKLESEIANVARIIIDEEAFNNGIKSIIERDADYGIIYDRYFVKVDPTIIATDFDGSRVLRFDPDHIEVKYLKYAKHPDQKNLNEDRIMHCINAGNQVLKRFHCGLKSALERAEDIKSRSKILYFIIKWNAYCEEFELKNELKEEYKIDIV